jgi:hypothetical protein
MIYFIVKNNYIKYVDEMNNVVYTHNKCVFEYEKCPICALYLNNKEHIYVLTNYDYDRYYHSICIENNHTLCIYCKKSLRVKYECCNELLLQ